MTVNSKTAGTFTGWHMLGIMLAFFGVIIAVNLTMAYFAVSSWSGLVVKNTYVASQEFNAKSEMGKAQAALGWQVDTVYNDGQITYRLIDKSGNPVATTGGTAIFRRPVGDAEDLTINLALTGEGVLSAPLNLDEGSWIMEINTDAGLDVPYRQVSRILIQNGQMQ